MAYRIPVEEDLPGRLGAVLAVVYLVYTEGHTASSGDRLVRADLCREAIRLGRLLAELVPDEPEVMGLLALMLLVDSRRAARTSPGGGLVVLAYEAAIARTENAAERDLLTSRRQEAAPVPNRAIDFSGPLSTIR